MNILLTITLTFIFSITCIADDFDKQKPDDVSDVSWASLKSAVQQAKLLPEPVGIGGENSQFGRSVSVDGNRALVGGPNMIDSGVVYVLDYDGISWQKTAILQSTDAERFDEFGISVSLSGDRALVGARGDDDNGYGTGSAYVFDYDGMNWTQSAKLRASDGTMEDQFGWSVSLSGDRALVGSYRDSDNGSSSGSAYVFDYDGMSWSQSAKLVAIDGATGDQFGYSVSLSGDRALVGARLDDDSGESSGSAYVFDYNGMNWTQSAKLTAGDGAFYNYFGFSVSLSGDRALVGAIDDSGTSSGSAYMFDLVGGLWSQTVKLMASDGAASDHFGYSVSLSGNRALVGARWNDDNGIDSGSAYLFDYDGMNWSQSAKLIANDGATEDQFGRSVSLSGDRVLVGAYLDDDNGIDSGSAYVFDFTGGSWIQTQKLTDGDGAAGDEFGHSVSLSGNRALVGAIGDDDNGLDTGSAYVFDYDGMNWRQSAKLSASDGATDDEFGYSVSLSGDRALVGARWDDDNGSRSGSAYVFDYDGMNWSQSQKLTASDGAKDDFFGHSVSLSGDRALVGAYRDSDNGSRSGSAYVFDYDGMSWSQSAKLVATDGATNDYFSSSVSLSGDRVLVSAGGDDDNGFDSGSAYVFDYDGINWTQSAKLIASDGASYDYFGSSVSISGDRALVGARGDDDNGFDSGSAYVFDYDGMNWIQSAKLVATDGASYDFFGSSVSLSGDRALMGALGHYLDSGSAYVFDYDGLNWTQSDKLTQDNVVVADYFGVSVSLSGNHALVGAYGDDDSGTDSGSAYVFVNDLIFRDGFGADTTNLLK